MMRRIGFTYDVKSDVQADAGAPSDALAELDYPETIDEIAQAIASGGFSVERIGHVKNLLSRIGSLNVDIVFNLCEGMRGRAREAEVPMLLEMHGVPYVGSDGLTLSLTLDKAMTKKVFVADGVPTPKYFVAEETTKLDAACRGMKFPMFVKPRQEGSSKGISEDSIVADKKTLKARIEEIHRLYKQPALVEEFIRGGEFTVLVIGNGARVEALAPVQISIAGKLIAGDLVYTSRRLTGDEILYVCPAKISKTLDKALRAAAIRAYQSVDCRDFGRVDFRTDSRGRVYVLEINPLPSLSTEDVFPLVAQAEGMTYGQLVCKIIKIGMERYGIE